MQSKKHDYLTKGEMKRAIGPFFCGLAGMLVYQLKIGLRKEWAHPRFLFVYNVKMFFFLLLDSICHAHRINMNLQSQNIIY